MGCVLSSANHQFDGNALEGQLSVKGVTDINNNGGVVGIGADGRQNSSQAKVVLLGESGVGKSSIALRFCQGRFCPYHEVTIGSAYLQQTIRLQDGNCLKLHIWDTGGQERFRAMAPLYYRDAAAAVIVYDTTFPSSFDAVRFWVNELQQRGPSNCKIAIAANKIDLGNPQIDPKLAEEFCLSQQMIFVSTSAKTGENVGLLFEKLAHSIAQS